MIGVGFCANGLRVVQVRVADAVRVRLTVVVAVSDKTDILDGRQDRRGRLEAMVVVDRVRRIDAMDHV